jgi:hypothetical protein
MSHPFGALHPTGEDVQSVKTESFIGKIPLETYAGKLHVEWDNKATVTPFGQLPFFIEFLKTTKLFDDLVADCPITFESNNASKVRDILGSMLLGVLSGQTRYSHLTTLRGEQVNTDLLGMSKVVSEDVVRRMLLAMDETKGVNWLERHLKKCYEALLDIPWILDLDTTVKPLYGKQEGAVLGYNPQKPGRPAHIYHSYFIANIRMALGVDVQAGNKNAGCYSASHLWELFDGLPMAQRPQFIRGDVSYGTERIMSEAEARQARFLFRIKCSPKIKSLIKWKMQSAHALWEPVGQGYDGTQEPIQLDGWSKQRRVVILRRKIANKDVGILSKDKKSKQLSFDFACIESDKSAYEYVVLVTNLEDEVLTLAQHYRDRGDSENNFDELKNQWGWCGFTTRDLKRCKLISKFIALIYDWWNLFVRLVDPSCHRESVTSRPLLLNAIGCLVRHQRQQTLTITSTHAQIEKLTNILSAVSQFFKTLHANAEQLTPAAILKRIIHVAFRKFFKNTSQSPPLILSAPA